MSAATDQVRQTVAGYRRRAEGLREQAEKGRAVAADDDSQAADWDRLADELEAMAEAWEAGTYGADQANAEAPAPAPACQSTYAVGSSITAPPRVVACAGQTHGLLYHEGQSLEGATFQWPLTRSERQAMRAGGAS